MLMRHAPMEQAKPNETGPSPLEIEALRDWIESLSASERQCPERQPVDSVELANTMQRWLEQSKPEVAKATRFISLAHLYNACANDAELAAYRQAVQKLLNGLSWARAPVRIETVGDSLVVLALRLNDIGWVPAHWDRLAGLEPAGGAVPVSDALKQMTGSPQPVLRADWLASAASRAPLYYELLGLPDRARELMRLHGLDIDANARPPKFTRAGLKSGGGLRGPMLAERHVAKDGQVLWLAYEWAAAVPPTMCSTVLWRRTRYPLPSPRRNRMRRVSSSRSPTACLPWAVSMPRAGGLTSSSGRPTPGGSAQQAGGSERRVERLHWMSRHRPAAVRG